MKNNKVKSKSLFKDFYPEFTYTKVEEIPLELLRREDIKLILMDMDNTLIDSKGKYTKELRNWIKEVKSKDIKLYIVSNSMSEKMVRRISKELNVQFYYKAGKPSTKGLKAVSSLYPEIQKSQILMMGDQLFTDVWAGNRFNVHTLLVKRINKKEIFISKIKRPFERIILNHYFNKEENADKCKF